MALAYETDHVFENLLKLSDHDSHIPIVLKLGSSSMQIASVSENAQQLGLVVLIVSVAKSRSSTWTQGLRD